MVLRGIVYHFRRGVPDDLRQRLNRRELVRSLGTGDIRAAKLAACRLYVASEGLFLALRGAPMLTDGPDRPSRPRLLRVHHSTERTPGRLARSPLPANVREMRVTESPSRPPSSTTRPTTPTPC
ncbi:DUF6538 domain-containing protein [Methylobacterium sp. Leaf118]|uniref:DUF6538 domain-containing protein n=1 Tax=Methylobacterium sp. Leaf118 TaxID=2876562 RepID=UPI002FCCF62B